MNSIEKLRNRVEAECPGATCTVDAPPPKASPGAPWFLDCRRGDHYVVVEWRRSQGFGLSTGLDGPDEGYPEEQRDTVLERLIDLLHGGQTGTVRALRENRGVTQSELASRLGISQPALSQLERREDLQLSTLRRVVEGLGGTLNVEARFPDGSEARIDLGK